MYFPAGTPNVGAPLQERGFIIPATRRHRDMQNRSVTFLTKNLLRVTDVTALKVLHPRMPFSCPTFQLIKPGSVAPKFQLDSAIVNAS
jgi:hypothetical protein